MEKVPESMNYINTKKIKSLEEMSSPGDSDRINPALFAYTTDCKMCDQPQLFYYIHNYQLQSVDAVVRYNCNR